MSTGCGYALGVFSPNHHGEDTQGVYISSAWASALLVQSRWAMRRPRIAGRVTGTDSRAFFFNYYMTFFYPPGLGSLAGTSYITMKVDELKKGPASGSPASGLFPAYTKPEVEILVIHVERGYASSFSSGDAGGGVSTGSDFGWSDDIEL